MSGKYAIEESKGYFGRLEGRLESKLFGGTVFFQTKNCDVLYGERCAEYFEKLTLENEALYTLFKASGDYISELFAEHKDEFDLGEADYNEILPDAVSELVFPELVIFERSPMLADDDCPIAFSVKMSFRNIADEFFEAAMREDNPIYVGEHRGVSPWNDGLKKKKWNYVKKYI